MKVTKTTSMAKRVVIIMISSHDRSTFPFSHVEKHLLHGAIRKGANWQTYDVTGFIGVKILTRPTWVLTSHGKCHHQVLTLLHDTCHHCMYEGGKSTSFANSFEKIMGFSFPLFLAEKQHPLYSAISKRANWQIYWCDLSFRVRSRTPRSRDTSAAATQPVKISRRSHRRVGRCSLF